MKRTRDVKREGQRWKERMVRNRERSKRDVGMGREKKRKLQGKRQHPERWKKEKVSKEA